MTLMQENEASARAYARGMLRGAGMTATDEDIDLLAADLESLRDEDMPDALMVECVTELARRVGHGNLPSYMECLRVKG